MWIKVRHPQAQREKNVVNIHWVEATAEHGLNSWWFSYSWFQSLLEFLPLGPLIPFFTPLLLKLVCRDLLPPTDLEFELPRANHWDSTFLSFFCCLSNLEKTCCPLILSFNHSVFQFLGFAFFFGPAWLSSPCQLLLSLKASFLPFCLFCGLTSSKRLVSLKTTIQNSWLPHSCLRGNYRITLRRLPIFLFSRSDPKVT